MIKNILLQLIVVFSFLFGDDNLNIVEKQETFGANLFKGNFKENKTNSIFNEDYLINSGDEIDIKIWGSINSEYKVKLDIQGNIYIPNVGVINLKGVQVKNLQSIVSLKFNEVYKKGVFVYASLNNFQYTNVLVTGNVNNPGMYDGFSNDTVLTFIDKAGGISNSGSFRDIRVLRNGKVIEEFDLYNFLFDGELKKIQIKSGDVVFVANKKKTVKVIGDVKRSFIFELKDTIKLHDFLKQYAVVNGSATDLKISKKTNDILSDVSIIKIKNINEGHILNGGEFLEVISEHFEDNIEINIIGEHHNKNTIVIPKGTTLSNVLKNIKLNQYSDIDNIQLFRKSISIKQKELIEKNLNELETLVLTNTANSLEEAQIQKNETEGILKFIERAKKVIPKGQLIIRNNMDYDNIILEAGDTINIPSNSNVINVHGEVYFPNTYSKIEGNKISDYIDLSGGINERGNDERVLIIEKNGFAKQIDMSGWFGDDCIPKSGTSILIIPKVETKSLQVAKDITQILYHIAVSTGVLLSI